MIKHYSPQATFEQIVAFRPDHPETYTPSPLVNAIAEVLYSTQVRRCCQIATHLGLDSRSLCVAFKVETGLLLDDVVADYRLVRAKQYLEDHPDVDLNEAAKACGYADSNSLWHAFQRKLGITPTGKKSSARKERYLLLREEIRQAKEAKRKESLRKLMEK